MRTDLPESRTVVTQATAVERTTGTHGQLHDWLFLALGDVASYLYHKGIPPIGFPFARYHVRADGRLDVEAGFPVGEVIDGNRTIAASSLPAGHVVVAWHVGPYEKVGAAYDEIDEWLAAEDAERSSDAWEVYHDGPTGGRLCRHTEVVQPFNLARVDA